MKSCDACKWAEWKRTKTGRLHPDKTGKCTYPVKPLPTLPNCMYWGIGDPARKPSPYGGWIVRGHEYSDHCPTWASATPIHSASTVGDSR